VSRPARAGVVLTLLGVALVLACLVSAAVGAFEIPIGEILGAIGRRLPFLGVGGDRHSLADSVLWDIRLPRIALGVVVGASLAAAGACMQGTFANPLAEPGVVGVSSGAALGAVIQIAIGLTLAGTWTLAAFAFIGGLATVALVYFSARHEGRTEVVTLVLAGVAINAFAGALIGLLTYVSNDEQLRSITFWSLGSLAQATWPKVGVVGPLALAGFVVAMTQTRRLDLLALGERSARGLGVDVERLRITTLAVVALLTAASVAVSGVILFVGLVVPHLVRMLAGPRHRVLLPGAALGGALVLVLADVVARTLVSPAELPLGVLTALIGSPFFFVLLRRTRASQGGWA
jgi:iron complex transport system permease protein